MNPCAGRSLCVQVMNPKHDTVNCKCILLAYLLTYVLYLLTGVWCDIGQVHAALVWGVAQEHGSTCAGIPEVRNPWLL